jgi:hypothetical protein
MSHDDGRCASDDETIVVTAGKQFQARSRASG